MYFEEAEWKVFK